MKHQRLLIHRRSFFAGHTCLPEVAVHSGGIGGHTHQQQRKLPHSDGSRIAGMKFRLLTEKAPLVE